VNKLFITLFITAGLVFFVFFACLPTGMVFASIFSGTVDSTYKYAWGDRCGWINFGTGNGNVAIVDDRLTGYIWSEVYGWINLAPNTSGVKNNREGTLSGYAWGESTGWVNFSGVIINSEGQFTGRAFGETTGTINFDCVGCTIKTDWRPVSIRTGGPSTVPLSSPLTPDIQKPEVVITYIKDKYSPDEEVIIGGTTNPNLEISIGINGIFGLFSADDNGEWLITLGKKPLGEYSIELTAKDLFGNLGKTTKAKFTVESSVVIEQPTIIEKIGEEIKKLIPPIFGPEKKVPGPVTTVSSMPPLSLNGRWHIFPIKPINLFVLSPLPSQIKMLAQKFPELASTFKDVGITKITDVEKLRIANLKLPGLTQTLGLAPVEIRPGKFAPPKGVPVTELSSIIKQSIPSEIVFVRTGGGLIDLNIALSIGSQGKPEQRIEITAGAPLQLVVKVDTPAKKIKGYIVFKSKKPKEVVSNLSLNYLTASLMFDGPNLAENQDKPENIEERLVLLEFEYEDTGDGVYIATIQAPIIDGEYEIITAVDYEGEQFFLKEIKLITVIDPEGYIYEKNGGKETRISGAVAQLYWLNPGTKQYELWPAKIYQQENPQSTDVRGTYSFLVPEGYYYLKVDAPGYLSYDGKPFEVKEGSGVHINVEMKTKYWWLKIADWKTVLLAIVVLMLLYNFYKDKMRERSAIKS
jgi:hypothetical protein